MPWTGARRDDEDRETLLDVSTDLPRFLPECSHKSAKKKEEEKKGLGPRARHSAPLSVVTFG